MDESAEVKSFRECEFEGGSYDIEVEDNHNYFVEGILVHNCRGWVINFDGVTKAYSRNYSQKDCSLPEYWGNILQECSDGEPFAFDAEIKYEPDAPLREILAEYGVATDSQLEAMSSLLQINAPQAL